MKSIRKQPNFRSIVSQICLLRWGPARRQTSNYRVCTLATIARITSLSIGTVRNILNEQSLLLQENM